MEKGELNLPKKSPESVNSGLRILEKVFPSNHEHIGEKNKLVDALTQGRDPDLTAYPVDLWRTADGGLVIELQTRDKNDMPVIKVIYTEQVSGKKKK